MNRIWVGTITGMLTLVTLLGAAGSTPHEDVEREDFTDGIGDFDAVAGNVSAKTTTGGAGDVLTWLIVEDDNTTDSTNPARARANNTERFNTSLTSYYIHAKIDRTLANNSTAADWIGMTFGETATEYYMAQFNNTTFRLVSVDKGSGNQTAVVTEPDWGGVPAYLNDTEDNLRYSLLVDGTTLTVDINNFTLGRFSLPTIPAGTFGFAAAEGTSAWVEQVVYGPLDVQGPSVEIYAPFGDSVYFDREHIGPVPIGGHRVVSGTIIIGADIRDDITGAKVAHLQVDGVNVLGGVRVDPGIKTEWAYDTSHLSAGLHNVTVYAYDHDNNYGAHSIDIFVVNEKVSGKTVADARTVVGDSVTVPEV